MSTRASRFPAGHWPTNEVPGAQPVPPSENGTTVNGTVRPPEQRWLDAHGTSIPVGAVVEQTGVDIELGALRSRQGKQGQVLRRSATRLVVCFHGEGPACPYPTAAAAGGGLVSGRARSPYDPWRNMNGTSIPVGARVEQVAVAQEHDALTVRLNKHGVVISLGGRSGRVHRLPCPLRRRERAGEHPATLLRMVNP